MKKSLSAIFCLVIMLSLSVPVSASAFDSSNYASSNSSAVAQSQYEMLMDSFGFDSSLSDIVYPSNYGGAYINSEGALVVMQTNSISSSSRGGNFASVLNEAGSFILDTVSYSYNELNSLKSEIDDACLSFQSNPSAFSDDQANLLNSISFFYISQKDNSIIVGITDLNDSKRNSFLDMFGASDAYMLIEGLHTTTTASLKPGGDIVSPAGPLSIGWPVYFYDENDNVCRGFVSAGHAYSTGDSATLNGMTIGVCVDSAFSGRNDAALIKITNSNYSMSDVVNVSNHTLSNDKYMLVSEGSTIYKVGSTSGYRSGTVTSTNGSVTYRINNQPLTISNVLVTDAMNRCSVSTSALQKSSPHFDDVPSSYWAYDAIMEAAEAGIVFGFGDGTFQPNSPVTYAQFSALLGRAFYPSELDFSDYDSWYEPYTIVLSEHNVLLNLESDKLDNSLSIFDMAQLLYNVLVDYCIFSPSDPPFISSLDNLHLLDNIPSEYHSAIRTIYSLGLLDDFFDLFSTGDIRISRAQACIVINRLSSYLTPGNKTTLSGLIIGGQLTVSETTPIDAKILLSNAGCDVFSYSAILALKYYKEGSWVDIPFNSPDNTVSEVAILHQLMPGQEKVFTFDLSYYYGSISEGYYKLEIVLTQNGKNYSLSDIFFISN